MTGIASRVDPRSHAWISPSRFNCRPTFTSREAQRTRVWRHDQFVGLGFDLARGAIMADDARVDLAQARRLVALGCPLETASRILL
jgi:hypothetical protein